MDLTTERTDQNVYAQIFNLREPEDEVVDSCAADSEGLAHDTPFFPCLVEPSVTASVEPSSTSRRRAGSSGHYLEAQQGTMFRLLTLMPTPGRLPSRETLLRQADRTRAGLTTYEELVKRGHATTGLRVARNTIYSKRVGLGWLTKFVTAMNLPTEVMDPHVIGVESVVDRILAGMEYVADCAGSKNETGLALAATVATYANVWVDAHQLLPTPIDLSWLKPRIKAWKAGRVRNMTGAFGIIKKLQKAGITRSMMEGMYEDDRVWVAACQGNFVLVIVVKAAAQLAFVMMLRRSEYTLVKGVTEFNPHLRMTRSNIVWIGADGRPLPVDEDGNLSLTDLIELCRLVYDPNTELSTFQGRMDATVKTSKSDQTGDWSSHIHPIALRLNREGAVIKAANYFLEYEIAVPVLNLQEREETPLFVDPSRPRNPAHRGQLKVEVFNEVVIDLLFEVFKRRGDHRSKAEVRKMYSLHSFRIGGVNHLRAAGVPREIRMILGRWRSDAIDTYSRTDVQQFIEYLKDHGVSAKEFETLADDLPYHEGAHGVEYGKAYDVVTLNDSPLPKLVPEITTLEASHELRSLTPSNHQDEPLSRAHSLVGRSVEMYFDCVNGPPVAVPGTVETITPGSMLPCGVRLLGESELEYYSIQDVVDHLTMHRSEEEDA